MTFFSHRPGFSNFPSLLPDFQDLYFVRCRTQPFPHKNNTFFYSVHTFAHIRQHYFSKYWGDECMGRPPPQTLGAPSPQSPLGFRPCSLEITQTKGHTNKRSYSQTVTQTKGHKKLMSCKLKATQTTGHTNKQRRQSGFKSGGRGSGLKKIDFSRQIYK